MFPGLVSGLRVDTGYCLLAYLPASCLAALAPLPISSEGPDLHRGLAIAAHPQMGPHRDRRL